MKKENKKIKIFFKNKTKKFYEDKDNLDANRIWKIMIMIFIIINLSIVVLSWFLFLRINSGEIFIITQDSQVSIDTINRNLLHDTISSFEEMSDEFEELKIKKLNILDPSL